MAQLGKPIKSSAVSSNGRRGCSVGGSSGGGGASSTIGGGSAWPPAVAPSACAKPETPQHARHSATIRAMLAQLMVRRLPVLQNQDTDDAAAARRPRWQWVLIGAGLVITLFLPLSWIGVWLGAWLSRAATRAEGGAGALVGRFGGRAKAREAALSGSLGALVGWGLAALGGSLSPWLVAVVSLAVLMIFGAGAAFVGARLTLSRRV